MTAIPDVHFDAIQAGVNAARKWHSIQVRGNRDLLETEYSIAEIAAKAAAHAVAGRTCEWTVCEANAPEVTWETACGDAATVDGTYIPGENNFLYCHKCGGRIVKGGESDQTPHPLGRIGYRGSTSAIERLIDALNDLEHFEAGWRP